MLGDGSAGLATPDDFAPNSRSAYRRSTLLGMKSTIGSWPKMRNHWKMERRLDDKLDCKACGTIQMDIPDNAKESTPIHCSNCGAFLGEWGELQDDFYRQARGTEAFDLRNGNIIKK
ncbi:hypothetical protein [Mesorhizobium sp.]|uniref:hypothetical protein n=2 Tax=unclassified Mesorhizobium TaxID=325217 RepID=UPI0025C36EC0|nr:hypothetical protein [Mesorhizobium sp.]